MSTMLVYTVMFFDDKSWKPAKHDSGKFYGDYMNKEEATGVVQTLRNEGVRAWVETQSIMA